VKKYTFTLQCFVIKHEKYPVVIIDCNPCHVIFDLDPNVLNQWKNKGLMTYIFTQVERIWSYWWWGFFQWQSIQVVKKFNYSIITRCSFMFID